MKKVSVETKYFSELMDHLQKVTMEFGRRHSRGEKHEDIEIALLVVKSFTSLMVASIAKVLDDKPKEKLIELMMEEIKDQFFAFDELENKKATYQ